MNDLPGSAPPSAKLESQLAKDKAKKDSPEAIAKAASQFESLLIGQLLQSARSGEGGWMDTDQNEPGSSLTEMSEQVLASTLASKGGLGLATLVSKGLEKSVNIADHNK